MQITNKKYAEYRKMASSFYQDPTNTEIDELLSDALLNVLEEFNKNPNKIVANIDGYVFITIKHAFWLKKLKIKRKLAKEVDYSIDKPFNYDEEEFDESINQLERTYEDYETENEEDRLKKIKFIEDFNLSCFEKKLIKAYFYDGMTYQAIQDKTNIIRQTIWHKIKSIKIQIKQQYELQNKK